MTCITSMAERCNQIMNCRDESDEDHCSLLVLKESYNKKVPPFTINTNDSSIIPVSVGISTSLMNVLEISEFWYENSRVTYHNLKIKEALNIISDEEVIQKYQI